MKTTNYSKCFNVYSGTSWEEAVAYCRAKRIGQWVFVSGTTATDENQKTVAPNDMAGQTAFILSKIERALAECGATLLDVMRTRIYLTDMDLFEDFAVVHQQFFKDIDPVATCVEVKRLISPDLLIEIEADAVVQEGPEP